MTNRHDIDPYQAAIAAERVAWEAFKAAVGAQYEGDRCRMVMVPPSAEALAAGVRWRAAYRARRRQAPVR